MTAEERDVMSRIAGKLSLGGDHGLRIADELRGGIKAHRL